MGIFNGLAIQVQVAIITGLIGFIVTIINYTMGKKNIKLLVQKRYIDTISAERIKWIEKTRDAFVEFTRLTTEISIMADLVKKEKITEIDEHNKIISIIALMNATMDRINLLLNPTELFSRKLKEKQKELTEFLLEDLFREFEQEKYHALLNDIEYINHVILKSEWKRIKEETKLGDHISEKRMEEILKEVAIKISKDRYDELIKAKSVNKVATSKS